MKKPIAPTPNPILDRPWQMLMRLLRDSRVGWRQLVSDPLASAIVIFGLATAIACGQLVAQLLFNEVLPDTDIPDPARVVSIEYRSHFPGEEEPGWLDSAPFVFGDALRRALPTGAQVTRASPLVLHAQIGDRVDDVAVVFVDAAAVPLFGLVAERGDVGAALRFPDTLVLTRQAAQRLFGTREAVGRTLRLHGQLLTVAAIIERPSSTLMRNSEALARFDSPANVIGKSMRESWFWSAGQVYARLAPGQSVEDLGRVAQSVFDRGSPASRDVPAGMFADHRHAAFVRAMPVTRGYLEGAGNGARRTRFFALLASAVLVLDLALANYVNLTMVRTLARSREIAVRKSLGADPRRLTVQFMLEAVMLALCAVVLGLLLAWLLAPTLGGLLWLNLDARLFAPARVVALVALALAVGAATGLVPARIALGVRCAETLAGRPSDEGVKGRRARRALTTVQFTIALVISGAACVSYWQVRFVDALPHGFRGDGLVAVDLPIDTMDAVARDFRAALSRQPGVTGLAWSSDVPARNRLSMTGELQRRPGSGSGTGAVKARLSTSDADFFDLYGIAPMAGQVRGPAAAASDVASPRDVGEPLVVVDTVMARALGFAQPRDAVDALVFMPEDPPQVPQALRIVAVVPPVHQETAHEAAQPQMFRVLAHPLATLTLRGPDPAALRKAVAIVWPRFFPDETFNAQGVLESLAEVYEEDRRIGRLAGCASLLALALAGFGVYALAAYTVRRSLREIVVRKLYGAGRWRIAAVLARDVAPLLLVAAGVGLPLTGWLVQAWLAGYVARTPLAWWSLPVALLAVLATATLATWRHGRAAMRVRPVDALRD